MELRRSILPAAVAGALILAACGGGSSSSTADVQNDIDAGIDKIIDVADDIVTTTIEDVPETTDAPAPEPEPEPETVASRCAERRESDIGFRDVECDQPHDAELAGLVAAPDGQSPTDEVELDILLTSACLEITEAFAGQSLDVFGVEVSPWTETVPGDDFAGDVECWLHSPTFGSLTGSLRDVDLTTALGDFVTLASVAPGECFLVADDNNGSISVGTLVDCSTQYVDQILGNVTVDDGPFPGSAELFELGDELCAPLAADAPFELIGDATIAIVPFEVEWEALGIRELTCSQFRPSDYDDQPVCGVQIPSEGHDPIDCSEPHDSEFVGFLAPPDGNLPDDPTEAEVLVTQLCAPMVSEFLGGRDLSTSGIGVGFDANTGLGDPFVDDVNCWAVVGSPVGLNASIAEVGLETALGDYRIIAELEPGTCFTFAPDTFDLGVVADCATPDALMAVGNVAVDLDGPWPGDDALREIRFGLCSDILAQTTLAVDPASVSGTFPNEIGWLSLDRRYISCDATPL